MNNPRIVRQDGSFFLFGINGDKSRCATLNKDWIKPPITVPHSAKERILAELDQMDYNEGFFYPDFEHINHVIRKRFSRRQWRTAGQALRYRRFLLEIFAYAGEQILRTLSAKRPRGRVLNPYAFT
jgi:hypothetical protein